MSYRDAKTLRMPCDRLLTGLCMRSKIDRKGTYRSAGDGHLDLTLGSTHQGAKLLAHALKNAQTVVLGQGGEEVLHGLALHTKGLLQLGNDLLLVLSAEGGRRQDGLQTGVLLEGGRQVLKSL